ncbi:uncharacterized protein [Drosophila kikkawai]|uniref:Uncharacterized protein n=1 Tax=Drosophila kikkawai TaxID=30033 RepID=A0A6P4IZV2_DROKI|nr:uncharacterized protein LOC108078444 isoform X1 [Drosophila kikkawai]XP_017027820.1 uncharacterized protein LOC108078444 isoform X1 [Drosophila kikkawai]
MGEDAPPEGPPQTPAPPPTTTKSGASMMSVSPWFTTAVVAAYAARALWVKLRHAGSASWKQKLLKNEHSKEQEDEIDSDPEVDSEYEYEAEDKGEVDEAHAVVQDGMLKHLESDTGPMIRSSEL